jgi:AcrR family transcriptional regulator
LVERSRRDIQQRVLDAAEQALLENGLTARLHAAIARRAGLSRPTVYKHVGDQSAIVQAVLQREFVRLWQRLEPVLTSDGPLQQRLVDTIVGVVDNGRRSPLLQKALRDSPEQVLSHLTVNAAPFIEQTVAILTPHLPPVNGRALGEWAYRLTASLLITAGVVPTTTEDELRRFVSSLLILPPA